MLDARPFFLGGLTPARPPGAPGPPGPPIRIMNPPPPRFVASSHTSPPLTADTRSIVGPPAMPNESVRFILSGNTNSSADVACNLALTHDPARRASHRERLDLRQSRLASEGPRGPRPRISPTLASTCGLLAVR